MTEEWKTRKPSLRERAPRWALVLLSLWLVVSVPLVIFLLVRDPEQPAPPEYRKLTALESQGVSAQLDQIRTGTIVVDSTYSSDSVRLDLSYTADAGRKGSYGTVRSGQTDGDYMVTDGRVFLRGGAPFWSTLGVSTNFPGWIDIGDRLGKVVFPLDDTVNALSPNSESEISEQGVYRSGDAKAHVSAAGIDELTAVDGRIAKTRVAQDARQVGQQLDKARGEIAGSGKLTGSTGSLAVDLPKPADSKDTPKPSEQPKP